MVDYFVSSSAASIQMFTVEIITSNVRHSGRIRAVRFFKSHANGAGL